MQISLEFIANAIDGELIGSGDLLLTDISFLNEAGPNELAFAINKDDCEELELEDYCKAGAVIVPDYYAGTRINVIKVKNMQLAIAKAIGLFNPKEIVQPAISPQADIHSSASIGEAVYIGPFVSIGANSVVGDRTVIRSGALVGNDVVIGDDTTLSYRVLVLPRVRIGNRVVVQPGTLIGGDGFGYVKDDETWVKIPDAGTVVIEDDVSLGAYNTIERGNIGQTLIRQGVKTGNSVHIGHNSYIGRNTSVGMGAGIASNTFVGDNVFIGPKAGISEKLSIGHGATIGPKAGIITDVENGGSVFGTPGMSRAAWMRSASLIPKLSSMRKEISRLSRRIEELQSRLED